MPDLDREVTAHWGRGVKPTEEPSAAPAHSASASLEFGPAESYFAAKSKERLRLRRRLLVSLVLGLVIGTPLACAAIWFFQYVESRVRGTETLGQRITFGQQDQEEIYYTDDVSTEQAQQLGAFLQREGIFDGLRPKSVRVSKNGNVFVVGFALAWNNWEGDETIEGFHELLPRLSHGAFHGSPVEIHLCARQPDSQGRPMPTMRVIRADEAP